MQPSSSSRPGSYRIIRPIPLILAALLLALVAGGPLLAREEAPDQDPDFSAVDDPLNGDYELFTVDDLLIMRTKLDAKHKAQVNNYIMETANFKVSNQIRREVISETCPPVGGRQAQRTRIGRFFNLGYDVILTLTTNSSATGDDCSGPNNMALWLQDDQTSLKEATVFSLNDAQNTAVAMDDFTLDGFEDIVVLSNGGIVAATAVDINDPGQGMMIGEPVAFTDASLAPWYDPTSGDFNADGLQDVAWISVAGAVHFATVCPGSVAGTICAGKNPLDVLLDPLQSQATPITVTTGRGNLCRNPHSLAAGDFTNDAGDGLVIIDCTTYTDAYGYHHVVLNAIWYQFANDWSAPAPVQTSKIFDNSRGYVNATFAQAGKLNWLSDNEQLVVAIDTAIFDGGPFCYLSRERLTTFEFSNNQMVFNSIQGKNGGCNPKLYDYPWIDGMALGRFADISSNTSDSSAFNQQIATLLNDGSIHIWSVYPGSSGANTDMALLSETAVDSSLGIPFKAYHNSTAPDPTEDNLNWLVSGDLQGRSARLGPPNVLRVSSHSQPSIILGAPPMHVDYIQPDQTTSPDPDIVNVSAIPSAFHSQYTMSQSGSNQSSDTNTTSYSYTTTEMGGKGFSLKPPYLPAISGKISTTTTDKNEDVTKNYAFTKDEFEYDASTQTGFGDEIWYSISSFNLYVYPVLGQTICPADNPTCTAEEEQPLYVMFSGPNSSGTGPASGATTEWYQPLHEPGNIFSYPWSYAQLEQRIGNINLLSGPQSFFTDDSTQTQNLNWTVGSGADVSAGSVNSHSYEKGYSLTAGKTIGTFVEADIKSNFNYDDSSSVETLNQSSSTVGASQGIAITKPGRFLSFSLYQYRVEPYIFGRVPNPQTIDHPDLPTSVQTYGPLQAAFVANPKAPGSGSWWSSSDNPYNKNFDVALNHPVRWTVNSSGSGLNCLGSDCLIFNDPLPGNLWSSQFYWMRGLFVTVNSVNGPQRNQATAGDTVYLTARVYNYSFTDMPSGSTIKVRFYRQPLNGTVPSGNSVLVGETALNALNGFNSDSAPDSPNWATAGVSFDTTGLDNSNQIFWVLVWAEDGAGNLLSELSGHGLSAKPGTLNSIGDAPLEMVTLAGAQRTFSNNVGYLHSKFYIAPANAQALPPFPAPALTLANAQVTPEMVAPGDLVLVSANVSSEQAPADAVLVQFFPSAGAWQANQDDPSQPQPRAFDVEMLPHIGLGQTDRLEVPFRTSECGRQEILIAVQAGAGGEVTTAVATFDTGACQVFTPVIGGK